MSADLYHIEFERSENISNLSRGKYIEPSEATAYRQLNNRICVYKCSASCGLIKDYKIYDKSNAKALMANAISVFCYPPGSMKKPSSGRKGDHEVVEGARVSLNMY